MPSYKRKDLETTNQKADSAVIPDELDRQLQAAAAEITRDAAGLAAEITGAGNSPRKSSSNEPEEDCLRLVQDLVFHTIGYAHHFSLVLTRPYTERIVPRLLALFSDCFYHEFFSGQDRPGSYEYFKMVFAQDYLSFFREMEEGGMLSLPPVEYTSRTIDALMDSAALQSNELKKDSRARDLISEFVEKQAFLKISRVVLSF